VLFAKDTVVKNRKENISTMSQQLRRIAFAGTGAIGFGTSAYMFHTLTDFSQAIVQREDRNEFMAAYNNRHERAAIGMAGIVSNAAIYWSNRKAIGIPVYVATGLSAASLGLWYGGYLNPEIVSLTGADSVLEARKRLFALSDSTYFATIFYFVDAPTKKSELCIRHNLCGCKAHERRRNLRCYPIGGSGATRFP
jgi:hypothetical protein